MDGLEYLGGRASRETSKDSNGLKVSSSTVDLLPLCASTSALLKVLASQTSSSLENLHEEADKLHRYARGHYRSVLLQRQIAGRRKLDDRSRLGDEENEKLDEWGCGIDGEFWEELKGLRKVDPPSHVTCCLLESEMKRLQTEFTATAYDGISKLALTHSLHRSRG